MKSQTLELLKLANEDPTSAVYSQLVTAYKQLCAFILKEKSFRSFGHEELLELAGDGTLRLPMFKFMTGSELAKFDKLFARQLQVKLEEDYEQMAVPFAIVEQAAQVFAVMTLKGQQREARSAESVPSTQDSINSDTEAKAESTINRLQHWLATLAKDRWMLVAILANMAIVAFALRHLANYLTSKPAF